MKTKTILAGIAGTGAASAVAYRIIRPRGNGHADEARAAELKRHLSDMIALDRELLTAIRRQLQGPELESFDSARMTLEETERALERHIADLDAEQEALGGAQGGGVKNIAASMAGAAASVVDRLRTEPVSRMLRDDYVALSLVDISYWMLRSTALAMDNERLADRAEACANEIRPLFERLGEAVPQAAMQEVIQRAVHPEAMEQAAKDIEDAMRQSGSQGDPGWSHN